LKDFFDLSFLLIGVEPQLVEIDLYGETHVGDVPEGVLPCSSFEGAGDRLW